jgi:hypothetical protein
MPTRFALRRLAYLFFLFFYVACTYAISQERVRLIVTELHHSAAHANEQQLDTGCEQLRNGFPNFQRAKPKTISILCFGLEPLLHQPRTSERSFHFHSTTSFKSPYRRESVLSRAPPSQNCKTA